MTDFRSPNPFRDDPDSRMSAASVALFLDVPLNTVYWWRHVGVGPKAIKVGKSLMYRRGDLLAWLDEQAA